ncbi:MAG TPA: hypothetical protein VGM84_09770 [Steroidobacteraceae bacterium]|jgi:hypothetical protein
MRNRIRTERWLTLGCLALLAVRPVLGEEEAGPKAVKLDASRQSRLGVVVTALQAVQAPSNITTVARVLDPGPLLALDGELATAEASQAASRAEAQRTRKLFDEDHTASARALEAAEATARADQEKVESARRRLMLDWGDGVALLAPAKRSGLLTDLARVRAELVRIELPVGALPPKTGQRVVVQATSDGTPLNATILGNLSAADPRLQTRGVLAELRGADATLPIGRMVSAKLPGTGATQKGVLLPRGALLREDGKVWAYVETSAGSYLRREVTGYQIQPDGWFVTEGFPAGTRVVTDGVASLHAIESPAETESSGEDKD